MNALWRIGIGPLATILVCGCTAAPPRVNFVAEYGTPPETAPVRARTVAVTAETAPQLIAKGFVKLGRLEVTAEHDATTALIQAASRFGADVVYLHTDNRVEVLSREACMDVNKSGEPSFCRQWNTQTGVCNLWSAPVYFECNKWESKRQKTGMTESSASLWRRESLAMAIIQGQSAVRAALAAGENPNAGWLPLLYAVDRPGTEVLHALLEGGARADVRVLGYAARGGRTTAVESLLAAQAPVNQGYAHPYGLHTTALHEAVRGGDPHIVELLISRGAEVNAIPWFGSPPLNDAVASGNTELIRILVTHGANPNLKGLNGTSAVDEAAKIPDTGRERILRALGTDHRP